MEHNSARILVMGAGLVGQQHIAAIAESSRAVLHCIVDPHPAVRAFAERMGHAWYPDLSTAIAHIKTPPDAVIIATPTHAHKTHVADGLALECPILLEKPIADHIGAAHTIVHMAKNKNIPLLVGYHRRHSALTQAAKHCIDSNRLGRIIAVQGTCWLYKPDNYFNSVWRTQRGAGPLGINLVHDIDLLCYLLGPVNAVQAVASHKTRGFEVEDTAALILEFQSGALGTLSVSDTIVAPWSWELTAGENKAYPKTNQSCYWIGGTHGALALPNALFWHNPEQRSWWEQISTVPLPTVQHNPLVQQIDHLCDVAQGLCPPRVTGQDGLVSLFILDAVNKSIVRKQKVYINNQ